MAVKATRLALISALCLAAVQVALPHGIAYAATLRVCSTCTYHTIGVAISAASSGDTIDIASGTYPEALSISKNLTLVGDRGGGTFLHAPVTAPNGNAVTITGTSTTVTIDRLWITGGSGPIPGTNPELHGNGILNGGILTLTNGTVYSNAGAGLTDSGVSLGGKATLTNVIIRDNGGGICNCSPSSGTIPTTVLTNVIILRNLSNGLCNCSDTTSATLLMVTIQDTRGPGICDCSNHASAFLNTVNLVGNADNGICNCSGTDNASLSNVTILKNVGAFAICNCGGGGTLSLSNVAILNPAGNGLCNCSLVNVTGWNVLIKRAGGQGMSNSAATTVTMTNLTVADSGDLGLCDCRFFGGSGEHISLTNATITGNGFGAHSGGICDCGPQERFANVTISGNYSGAIGNIDTPVVTSSVLAGNIHGDCQSVAATYSVIGNDGGCTLSGPTTGNQTGTAGSPINPKLGPLAENGGPVPTMALLIGSPAIDAGDPAGCKDTGGNPLTVDARGLWRPWPPGGRCDDGAYELMARPVVIGRGDYCQGGGTACVASDGSLLAGWTFADAEAVGPINSAGGQAAYARLACDNVDVGAGNTLHLRAAQVDTFTGSVTSVSGTVEATQSPTNGHAVGAMDVNGTSTTSSIPGLPDPASPITDTGGEEGSLEIGTGIAGLSKVIITGAVRITLSGDVADYTWSGSAWVYSSTLHNASLSCTAASSFSQLFYAGMSQSPLPDLEVAIRGDR
jgi:hypothetical protein